MNLIQKYNNFLPKNICEILINFINKNDKVGVFASANLTAKSRYFIPCENIKDNTILKIIKTYGLELNEKVKEYYKENNLFVNFGSLVKWTEGNSMVLHTDNHNSTISTYKYTAIIYLNDNFEGGFTFFDEQNNNYENHPKQGDALVFTSDDRCRHGVTEITKGQRFTYGLWFTDQENLKEPCFYS